MHKTVIVLFIIMLERGDTSYFHGLYYFEGPTNFSRTADPCSICVTDVKRLFP